MIEALQITLYPLGYISSLFFGSRFLIQWLHSEKKGLSTVPKTFWRLSFLGNLTLALHSLFQMQVHVLLMQMINGAIAVRNINLLGTKINRWPLKKVLIFFALAIIGALLAFVTLYLLSENGSFFRVPVNPWASETGSKVSFFWHIVGISGIILFGSRFVIQWILSEMEEKSFLGKTFFWSSLVGDLLCLAYFVKLGDSVNYIGPLFGLVPYIRNLMLLYKSKREVYDT